MKLYENIHIFKSHIVYVSNYVINTNNWQNNKQQTTCKRTCNKLVSCVYNTETESYCHKIIQMLLIYINTYWIYILTLSNQYNKYWQKHNFENTVTFTIPAQTGYGLVSSKGGTINSYICHFTCLAAIVNRSSNMSDCTI